MNELNVISCGTRYGHKVGYACLQSTYPNCYFFSFFQTKFLCSTNSGNRIGNPYSYILYTPYSNIYHTNAPDATSGFINDWMYFKGSYVEKLIKNLNILTGVIVPTYSTNTITEIIQQIQREISNDFIYKNEYIKSLITNLFIELARNDNKEFVIQDKDVYNVINNVRKIMLDKFTYKWTIESLAKNSGLSASYFASMYKKIYNKSPIDDLIDHRVLQAKFMLESNMMNIGEIGTKCGFNTSYYFSRTFKKKTGMSPSEYQSAFIQEQADAAAK